MSLGTVPIGKIITRALEAVLAVAMLSLAVERLYAGEEDAAVNNAIFAVALTGMKACRHPEHERYCAGDGGDRSIK